MADTESSLSRADQPLQFGFSTPQHWYSWEELRAQWHFAEQSGWDAIWVMDHFMSLAGGELGPCLEAWSLLAGLAVEVPRVQIGAFVTGMTHRHPAVLFKQAATVDHMSGGRLILGVGAAWNEREHAAFGVPFPPPRQRVELFEESMEALRLLETEERVTYAGKHLSLAATPFEPKPVNSHIPLLIGTTGRRMMRNVAHYADYWDGGGSPERMAALGERLDAYCREIGRDPAEITWMVENGNDPVDNPILSSEGFREHVRSYAAIGARYFIFNIPRGPISPTLREISERTIPELREELNAAML